MNKQGSANDAGAERRSFWDARYRAASELRPPSQLLDRWISGLAPGRALDLACGTGRNALLLARHGWRVLGVDISPQALRIAQHEARRQALTLDLAAVDLQSWPLPRSGFDLVCVFRFLDRALCPGIAAALRPGGVLIYETFTVAQRSYPNGPRDDAFLLQPGELPALFPTLHRLHSVEIVRQEDRHPRALAEFVGRKP